jgi:hypothetical protein
MTENLPQQRDALTYRKQGNDNIQENNRTIKAKFETTVQTVKLRIDFTRILRKKHTYLTDQCEKI